MKRRSQKHSVWQLVEPRGGFDLVWNGSFFYMHLRTLLPNKILVHINSQKAF